MLKTIRDMLIGAVVAGAVTAAFATANYGIAPHQYGDEATINQQWLYALSGGGNWTYQYGFTAVGTTQATAVQLPARTYLIEVDTAGAGGNTGVALPTCLAGTSLIINDNTAYTIDVYPSITNNPVTAAQDTINNGTSTTQTTYTAKRYSCGKTGVWAAE